jgi:hypothetical protein
MAAIRAGRSDGPTAAGSPHRASRGAAELAGERSAPTGRGGDAGELLEQPATIVAANQARPAKAAAPLLIGRILPAPLQPLATAVPSNVQPVNPLKIGA